ncbi:type II toxin-antitoxin system HicB family antitoxin [Acutalibacter intestini]|uniref:type II toxin-antitoxin system HicB family antitoxin n=1 Tax=Acutalibacter intestini TaxID=3093659 RepID=UPI002AC9B021|nr:type II toxin-antitoxin system HicB family antitoxin [Acutalibacter sp. M00204]
MQARNTLQYKNYTCLVSYFNVKDCLTGRVLGMSQIPSFTSKTIEGIKEEFHRAVDDYIAACELEGKKPAQAFTGNYTVRTSPAIHEALALYAAQQEVKFSQIIQQAFNEFIKNHDIEIPNREGK